MSEHKVTIHWWRQTDDFSVQTYNRAHEWLFQNGIKVVASAAPDYKGDVDRVNPEQAFTASLSSCHMLTFLYVAAMKQYKIDSYKDEAVGVFGKNVEGKMAVTKVILRPQIVFSGSKTPNADELAQLHDAAHKQCFIANSVLTEVVVE